MLSKHKYKSQQTLQLGLCQALFSEQLEEQFPPGKDYENVKKQKKQQFNEFTEILPLYLLDHFELCSQILLMHLCSYVLMGICIVQVSNSAML